MLAELSALRKKVFDNEQAGHARANAWEKERKQLLIDVDYWKDELQKALK